MQKKYPSEQRDHATQMVLDRLKEYPSVWAAAQGQVPKLGAGAGDAAYVGGPGPGRPGSSSENLAEVNQCGLRIVT